MKCVLCGRLLKNPESVAREMGPVCHRKLLRETSLSKKGRCTVCGKKLSDPVSIARGVGHYCQKNHSRKKELKAVSSCQQILCQD